MNIGYKTSIHKKLNTRQLINQIYDELTSVAMRDNIITEDESVLLHNIMANLQRYALMIETILEDGIITFDERVNMQYTRRKIINDATEVVMVDNILTDDEKLILKDLVTVIHTLKKNEPREFKILEENYIN